MIVCDTAIRGIRTGSRNALVAVGFLLTLSLLPYATSLANAQEPRPHVLLICVDDLRPELGCYGAERIHSPNIDALAAQGTLFERHYVQAPTCGASRYALLTGRYGGASNNALFTRARAMQRGEPVPVSLPAWFRARGYTTVSVGKVSHHPGGLGGADWNDRASPEMPESWDRSLLPAGPWQHPRGWMHGLANGEIRTDPAKMDVFQTEAGPDSIYPDGVAIDVALQELDALAGGAAAGQPFFLACGLLRPHLPFGAPAQYFDLYREVELPPIPHPEKPSGKTTWHASGEFMKYHRWGRDPNSDPEFAADVRRHYAACVSYADAQVGRLLDRLNRLGLLEDTAVILWGDHGWHLGEHAVWGKHTLFEESLRAPLIVRVPGSDQKGHRVTSIVETVDLFPTLCELCQLESPPSVDGRSLVELLVQPEGRLSADASNGIAISYTANAATIRTDRYRLIQHRDGHVELYDHASAGETANVAAAMPDVVEVLRAQLNERFER